MRIFFKLPDTKSRILYGAVSPEAADVPSRRALVRLELVEGGLILRIEARDLVALRAALNSFLRFIDASLGALEVASPSPAAREGF